MLVCGFSGISVEQMKKFRKELNLLGFNCKLMTEGDFRGQLCITSKNKEARWNTFLESLVTNKLGQLNKKILPLFFVVDDKLIGLNYFKDCVKFEGVNIVVPVIFFPFLKVMNSMIHLRLKGIMKSINMKANGNN